MGSLEFTSRVVSAGNKLAAWNAVAFCKQAPCSPPSQLTRAVSCLNVPCSSVSTESSEECVSLLYKLSCSLKFRLERGHPFNLGSSTLGVPRFKGM